MIAYNLLKGLLPIFKIHATVMKPTSLSGLFYLILTLLITSCSTVRFPSGYPDNRTGYPFPRDEKDRNEDRDKDWGKDKDRREGKDRNYRLSAMGVPKGHLPPPGECKVWFPGRPPGQQPPPTSCGSALRNAPLGAWVITHEGERYKVNIFNQTKKNVIDEVRYYTSE